MKKIGYTLLVLATVVLVSSCTNEEIEDFFGLTPGDTDAINAHSSLEKDVASEINERRRDASSSCDTLELNLDLHEAATAHSTDMNDQGTLTTVGSEDDTKTLDLRLTNAGYTDVDDSAEILELGFDDAETLVNKLMAVEESEDIILDCDYEDIGVGHETTANYWTILFAVKE